MSRVSYVQMNADGQEALTGAIRQAVADLAREAAARADIAAGEVLDLVVVGNPVMHHLFSGFDPRPLGTAPFALVTDGALTWSAADLNLPLHPGARVYALPCVTGHVGADTAAVILAEALDQADQVTLIVDVGTNASAVCRRPPTAVGGVKPHRTGLRGRPDQWRAAGRARRHRAGAHRPD